MSGSSLLAVAHTRRWIVVLNRNGSVRSVTCVVRRLTRGPAHYDGQFYNTRAWSRVAGRRASDNIWQVLVTAISVRGEQRVTVGFAETEITVDNCCFRLKRKNISFSKTYIDSRITTIRQLGFRAMHYYKLTSRRSLRMMRLCWAGIGWCHMAPWRCCGHSPRSLAVTGRRSVGSPALIDSRRRAKFFSAVHRRPRHFCELSSPEAKNSDESASARATPTGT